MSAEALRGITAELVDKEAAGFLDALVNEIEAPLDRLRYCQGYLAGMHRALELQKEAYKRVGM